MAGGGVKAGMTYGASDDFGFRAVENRVFFVRGNNVVFGPDNGIAGYDGEYGIIKLFADETTLRAVRSENPATLVQKDGKLIGIVSRYDLLQQLIGTR